MAPEPQPDLRLLDRVTVFSFGAHPGVITALSPEITVQGRTLRPENWVSVRLDDGEFWNGCRAFVARRCASPLRAATAR